MMGQPVRPRASPRFILDCPSRFSIRWLVSSCHRPVARGDQATISSFWVGQKTLARPLARPRGSRPDLESPLKANPGYGPVWHRSVDPCDTLTPVYWQRSSSPTLPILVWADSKCHYTCFCFGSFQHTENQYRYSWRILLEKWMYSSSPYTNSINYRYTYVRNGCWSEYCLSLRVYGPAK